MEKQEEYTSRRIWSRLFKLVSWIGMYGIVLFVSSVFLALESRRDARREMKVELEQSAQRIKYEICLTSLKPLTAETLTLTLRRLDGSADTQIVLTSSEQPSRYYCGGLNVAGRLPVSEEIWVFSPDEAASAVLPNDRTDTALKLSTYHPDAGQWYSSEHFFPRGQEGAWVVQVSAVNGPSLAFRDFDGDVIERDNRVRVGEQEMCAAPRGIDLGHNESLPRLVKREPVRTKPVQHRQRVRAQPPAPLRSIVSLGTMSGGRMHLVMASSSDSILDDPLRTPLGYKELKSASPDTRKKRTK